MPEERYGGRLLDPTDPYALYDELKQVASNPLTAKTGSIRRYFWLLELERVAELLAGQWRPEDRIGLEHYATFASCSYFWTVKRSSFAETMGSTWLGFAVDSL